MRALYAHWINENCTILSNASSLVGTTAVTSAIGFIYWWIAARLFPQAAVGLASAAISAMMLLGIVGVLGLGTMLIGELPRRPGRAGVLITTSLLVAGTVSGALGVVFALAAPHLSTELEPLAESFQSVVLFALGVALTAVTLVLDQSLIGLLRGVLQLWRNTLFAVAKLGALLIAGLWYASKVGLTIYATWVFGSLVSLAIIALVPAMKSIRITYRPQLRLMRRFGSATLKHHALNLSLQGPGFALPILVTVLLSATVNASFYAAWMIASFVFVVPVALTTVLYAVGAADPTELARKTRFTLKLSVLAGVLACGVLMVSAHHILNLFGSSYASQADFSLRILALGVFPMILKVHYVAISRVHERIAQAAALMAVGGSLELLFAALGASIAGLSGLSVGWVVAVCIEAVFMFPTVYRLAISKVIIPDQVGSQVGPPAPSMSARYVE